MPQGWSKAGPEEVPKAGSGSMGDSIRLPLFPQTEKAAIRVASRRSQAGTRQPAVLTDRPESEPSAAARAPDCVRAGCEEAVRPGSHQVPRHSFRRQSLKEAGRAFSYSRTCERPAFSWGRPRRGCPVSGSIFGKPPARFQQQQDHQAERGECPNSQHL